MKDIYLFLTFFQIFRILFSKLISKYHKNFEIKNFSKKKNRKLIVQNFYQLNFYTNMKINNYIYKII